MLGNSGVKPHHPGAADTADLLVGKTHESNREFLGRIDEVRIWNRALSEDEVLAEMDIGMLTPVDPLGKLATTWGTLKSQK